MSSLPQRLDDLMWNRRLEDLPVWQARLVWFARLVYALQRDFTQGYLSLQAMSLVYTTLLSLVPLLAVSFSVLKGFGVHNQLEPMLLNALAPLGDKAVEVTQAIIGFVDQMRVGVLGSVGLAILLYTVISLLHKIEQVFNYTWRVEQSRGFAQRFSQYLSVLLVGPVLFFSAVGISASLSSSDTVTTVLSIEPFGTMIAVLGRLAPYALMSLTFAFIYVFVPNTKVKVQSALIGGMVAAALWQAVGWVFAHFMVSSTQYTAIYSGLAIVILFMIWIYIAWLILLVGASVAFYHQHPEFLSTPSGELRLSHRLRERLALVVAGQVARSYLRGDPAWTAEALSNALGVPKVSTRQIFAMLEQDGYLLRSADDPPRYVPARPPESVGLAEILEAIRCFEESMSGCRGIAPDTGIEAIEKRIRQAIAEAVGNTTLKDLAEGLEPAHPALRQAGPRADAGAAEAGAPQGLSAEP